MRGIDSGGGDYGSGTAREFERRGRTRRGHGQHAFL
jgi:hypothetical protein